MTKKDIEKNIVLLVYKHLVGPGVEKEASVIKTYLKNNPDRGYELEKKFAEYFESELKEYKHNTLTITGCRSLIRAAKLIYEYVESEQRKTTK